MIALGYTVSALQCPVPPCKWMPILSRYMQLIEGICGMRKKFANCYILFYTKIPRSGSLFPVNRLVQDIKRGDRSPSAGLWRGDLVVAKFHGDNPFTSFVNAGMADYAIIKLWLSESHSPPVYMVCCAVFELGRRD